MPACCSWKLEPFDRCVGEVVWCGNRGGAGRADRCGPFGKRSVAPGGSFGFERAAHPSSSGGASQAGGVVPSDA